MRAVEKFIETTDGVYVLFCKPIDGWTYVKIGKTMSLLSRLAAFMPGCPFDYERVIWARAPSERYAYRIEAAVHRNLAPYNTAREWFRFKLDDPTHKEAFHAATRKAFSEVLGIPDTERVKWREVSIDQMRAKIAERVRASKAKYAAEHRQSVEKKVATQPVDTLASLYREMGICVELDNAGASGIVQ